LGHDEWKKFSSELYPTRNRVSCGDTGRAAQVVARASGRVIQYSAHHGDAGCRRSVNVFSIAEARILAGLRVREAKSASHYEQQHGLPGIQRENQNQRSFAPRTAEGGCPHNNYLNHG